MKRAQKLVLSLNYNIYIYITNVFKGTQKVLQEIHHKDKVSALSYVNIETKLFSVG